MIFHLELRTGRQARFFLASFFLARRTSQQESWLAATWRTHSCVPRRDSLGACAWTVASANKRREKSRRDTHECVRHACADRWAEGPWGTGLGGPTVIPYPDANPASQRRATTHLSRTTGFSIALYNGPLCARRARKRMDLHQTGPAAKPTKTRTQA